MKKMYYLVVTDDYNRFSWVFFLATKDETSRILKSIITGVENLIDQRVKVIRKPALGFMRPFGCPVRILNTMDYLGKFDGNVDEGFFVGYSINRSRPNWLFDIDALTKSMNYKPVVTGNRSNRNASTKACDDASKARRETSSPDAGFKPSGDNEKKVIEELRKEGGDPSNKNDSVNNTNNINMLDDGYKHTISEDTMYSNDYEDVGARAEMNNLNTFMPASPIGRDFLKEGIL
ncbi:hypothetical protein Tco_0765187 [Tanacetum coccineum]